MILATGSLPGLDAAVWSPEVVQRREARPGDTVIVYDEGGNWRGAGTALWLADQGRRAILATPDPMAGREPTRTTADGPIRRGLAKLGVIFRTEMCIARWHGNGATLRNLLSGEEAAVAASALVMATTNVAFDPFPGTLPGKPLQRIGDRAAPRKAVYACHEGRKLARAPYADAPPGMPSVCDRAADHGPASFPRT